MRREKGSALISVILVVLVLTMVGVASLFFMTTEERISNVSRMEKSAFYCAEVGLREAERTVVDGFNASTTYMSTALNTAQSTYNILEVPGGGYTGVVMTDADIVAHDDPGLALSDPSSGGIQVPAGEMRGIQIPNTEGIISTYSVYIRNNAEDVNPLVDTDNKINIVSVGTIVTPMGQIVRKVIEEQIFPGTGGGLGTGELHLNESGTSSTGYGE